MKKIKVKYWCGTGYSGCTISEEEELEFSNDATEEEIEKGIQ